MASLLCLNQVSLLWDQPLAIVCPPHFHISARFVKTCVAFCQSREYMRHGSHNIFQVLLLSLDHFLHLTMYWGQIFVWETIPKIFMNWQIILIFCYCHHEVTPFGLKKPINAMFLISRHPFWSPGAGDIQTQMISKIFWIYNFPTFTLFRCCHKTCKAKSSCSNTVFTPWTTASFKRIVDRRWSPLWNLKLLLMINFLRSLSLGCKIGFMCI